VVAPRHAQHDLLVAGASTSTVVAIAHAVYATVSKSATVAAAAEQSLPAAFAAAA
jgi:hypothetical protein